MARPQRPPRGRRGRVPPRRPRPQPDAGRAVADDGHPRRGQPHRSSTARWSKGPVGAAAPNHGDLVRVVDRDGQHARLRPLERPVADQPAVPVAQAPSRRARSSGPAGSTRPSPCGRSLLGLDRETNAYRVVHAEGDGLSGLIVDRFDDVLSVEIFSLGMYQRIGPILSLLADRLGTAHFRVGVDERVALQEDFSGRPLASPQLPPRVTIQEHGIRYRIHFEEGHKTGFFCDQRDNRRDLARFCAGRSVLDLCCYTGGFGLNALIRGKAREVTCVDLDEKAVALAKENGNANQVRLDVGPRRRLRLHAADGHRTAGPTAWSCSTRPS